MSKEAYYFSHDSNARNDEKIIELRDESPEVITQTILENSHKIYNIKK